MRYERKFKFLPGEEGKISSFLICNSFKEIYSKRIVNSIYYETSNFNCFHDSMNGVEIREKIRLRFYNNQYNRVQLELKNKRSELGQKITTNLDKIISYNSNYIFLNSINDANKIFKIPVLIKGIYRPLVFIKYKRRYYYSENYCLRVTIDSKLEFSIIKSSRSNFLIQKPRQALYGVLEIKHSDDLEPSVNFINSISKSLQLYMERSSKYCDAINLLFSI